MRMKSQSDSVPVVDLRAKASSRSSVKLHLSNIPTTMSEEDITHFLSSYCLIEKVSLIVNKRTKHCNHSAFVYVPSQQDAERLIHGLNGCFTFLNMRNPVQVSIANKKKYKRLNTGAAECINEEHDISDLESSSAGLPGACRPNLEKDEKQSIQKETSCSKNSQKCELSLSKPKEMNSEGSHTSSLSVSAQQSTTVPSQSSFFSSLSCPYPISIPQEQLANTQIVSSSYSLSTSPYCTFLSYPSPVFSYPVQSSYPVFQGSSDCHFVSDVYGCHVEGPTGANLFVYHLPISMTEEDLFTLFCKYGMVLSTKVYRDRLTNQSRGFGFVSYATIEASELAITYLNGFHINGKILKVQKKREK